MLYLFVQTTTGKLCPAGQTNEYDAQSACVLCAAGKFLEESMRRHNSECLECTDTLEGADKCVRTLSLFPLTKHQLTCSCCF